MSFVTKLNKQKEELFAGCDIKLDGLTFWATKPSMREIWMRLPDSDDINWYADVSDDGEIVKNEFPIFWIHEGMEYEGFAAYNESDDGDFITFTTFQNESKSATTPFDRVNADDLEGGEDELREIWEDLLSDAEASEDFRLNVTYTDLI